MQAIYPIGENCFSTKQNKRIRGHGNASLRC